jgi:hypothetical protein
MSLYSETALRENGIRCSKAGTKGSRFLEIFSLKSVHPKKAETSGDFVMLMMRHQGATKSSFSNPTFHSTPSHHRFDPETPSLVSEYDTEVALNITAVSSVKMSAALLEYLEQLPGLAFKRLYEQPSTVLAVLRRMLPHLGMESLE